MICIPLKFIGFKFLTRKNEQLIHPDLSQLWLGSATSVLESYFAIGGLILKLIIFLNDHCIIIPIGIKTF
jgi:hypothetical protein